jgi:hypothetical protein
MSVQELTFYLHLILAALYLPLLFTLIQRHEEHEAATMFLGGYVLIGLLLDVAEGLWRAGRLYIASPQVANDFQIYGALVLAFFLTLTVLSFIRRNLRAWLIVGLFWTLGLVLIILNTLGFNDVIWTNGRYSLTLERLAPAWAMLGGFIFMLGSVINIRSAYARSRQPLLRNRLNYWTPVFLLIAINDVLILVAFHFRDPIRLARSPGNVHRRHARSTRPRGSLAAGGDVYYYHGCDRRILRSRVYRRKPYSRRCPVTIRCWWARSSRCCYR